MVKKNIALARLARRCSYRKFVLEPFGHDVIFPSKFGFLRLIMWLRTEISNPQIGALAVVTRQ